MNISELIHMGNLHLQQIANIEKFVEHNILSNGIRITVADPGFSPGGAPTPKSAIIFQFFAENCMKMKEFGPPGGARIPGAPPWICQ